MIVKAGAALMVAAMGLASAQAHAAPLPKPPQFAQCGVCHKVAAGEKSVLGPNLWAIGGRKAGQQAGFTYSPAMKNSGVTWTRDKLLAFIQTPRQLVPGTRMAYAGQRDPKVAGAIADYLMSLK